MFLLKIRRCNRTYRKYSTKNSKYSSATDIRNKFIDYFINEHDHRFIRSSPVIPFCDPTVPFVNAGMNQFKNIFLGKVAAPCERAANSQKCIRISGKHNDLNVIGTDGYHHTFFEMLGNWSFGDYHKEKACRLAWNLLTESYMIDPKRLYVTYFGGDAKLGLESDHECKEIWRTIGVSEDHILPFGLKDNFWEMGLAGPCGPCTEIHIDHLPNTTAEQRARFVNAGQPDLTELWNIVFIEYNRQLDGTLEPLHEKYVDTGMGLERIIAVMQGKSSNYDTDLFTPIFSAISKETKMAQYSGIYDSMDSRYEIDYAYRVLADHIRMSSICIADGMYPQTSHRLRKIVRRSINICENVFKKGNLIENVIVPEVVNTLGHVYPELQKNVDNICETFKFENEFYQTARKRNQKEFHSLKISANADLCEEDTIDYAGFSTGFREVERLIHSNSALEILPLDFAYEKLHVNLGLTEELIEKIAKEKHLLIDLDGFAKYKQKRQFEAKMSQQRVKSSLLDSIELIDVSKTDYNFMYGYSYDHTAKQYNVKTIQAKLQMIQSDDNLQYIVLDKTNFYHTAGGQDSDIGNIMDSNGNNFIVEAVEMYNEYVFHIGHFEKSNQMFQVNQMVELYVNQVHRTELTQHHTAMHLLQAAIRNVTHQITYQQSSHVSATELKCDVGSIGKRIDVSQLSQIEDLVRKVIRSKIPIETRFLAAHDLYALDNVTKIPGEIYPDENIRVLTMKDQSISFESIEPCCGTHACNTGELEDFCITGFKFNGSTRCYAISAIAGRKVFLAREKERDFIQKFDAFKNQLKPDNSEHEWKSHEANAIELLKELERTQMPHITKANILTEIDEIKKNIHSAQRAKLREMIVSEMIDILSKRIDDNKAFVIHVLSTAEGLEDSLITDAEQVCQDLPVIILNVTNGKIVHARASVPIKYTTNKFNAKHWMEVLGNALNIKCQANKKKKQFAVCTFSDIPDNRFSASDLEAAIESASIAAEEAFTEIVRVDQDNRNIQEEDLIMRLGHVQKKLENEENVTKLIGLEAETKQLRNHIKNNLFVYTTKKKFIAEIANLEEEIFEARSTVEKNLVSSELNDSSLDGHAYIIRFIETEHILGNKTMMHATDIRKEIPVILINISNDEVIGRVSIPSQYTNDGFKAKHLGDIFNETFDGKCIHDGTRYDASVCDFRLDKKLVNIKGVTRVFEKIENIIKKVIGK